MLCFTMTPVADNSPDTQSTTTTAATTGTSSSPSGGVKPGASSSESGPLNSGLPSPSAESSTSSDDGYSIPLIASTLVQKMRGQYKKTDLLSKDDLREILARHLLNPISQSPIEAGKEGRPSKTAATTTSRPPAVTSPILISPLCKFKMDHAETIEDKILDLCGFSEQGMHEMPFVMICTRIERLVGEQSSKSKDGTGAQLNGKSFSSLPEMAELEGSGAKSPTTTSPVDSEPNLKDGVNRFKGIASPLIPSCFRKWRVELHGMAVGSSLLDSHLCYQISDVEHQTAPLSLANSKARTLLSSSLLSRQTYKPVTRRFKEWEELHEYLLAKYRLSSSLTQCFMFLSLPV